MGTVDEERRQMDVTIARKNDAVAKRGTNLILKHFCKSSVRKRPFRHTEISANKS